jgi:signal transduction histidine kinase
VSESPQSGGSATALKGWLRRYLTARTSFWRAQIELNVATLALSLLSYPIEWVTGTIGSEIFNIVLLGVFALAAWRLEPGTGSWWRRIARVLAWALIYGMVGALISWACLTLLEFSGRFYGIRFDDLNLKLGEYVLNYQLLILGLFLPTRMLLWLWAIGRTRLRWQLTFSYLLVGVLTMIILPLVLALFIGISSVFMVPPLIAPDTAAQRLTGALAPLVRRAAPPDEITRVLQGLLDGGAHLPVSEAQLEQDQDRPDNAAFTFDGVRRVVVVRTDGLVLASAGDSAPVPGTILAPEERTSMALLVEQARDGRCTTGRPADGPLIDSAACGILDAGGAPLATLIVENTFDSRIQWAVAVSRILTIVLIAVNLLFSVLPIALIVVFSIAVGIGSLLARQLTRRIERLAEATSDLAAGDLDRRVAVESPDEVGRLSADFNRMAVQLQERERALSDEAARSDALLRANRRLVADVSHELRTPLATLRGYLEALEQTHGDHLPAHDLAVIQREARRLTELIDDLFTLARAEAQQLPLNIAAVDAGALAQRLVDTLAPLARRERQIEVIAAIADDLPPVYADRSRLEQVLLNLAQNALRHTPPGGIVALEAASSDDGSVVLTIADTGIGIPADELPLVFERFYRSDSSRARETGGAGLGLALVHELVAAMGGSVTATSEPGRGSCFCVVLRSAPQPVLEAV